MVRTAAFGLRIGLGHIRSGLGRAVVFAPVAVIDVARRIQPHQTRTTTRRDSLSRLRRRGSRRLRRCSSCCWSSGCRCGRCLGCSSWCLCSSRCRGLRCCSRSRRSGRSGRVPLLHTLMSMTRPLFAGGRRVSPIFTLTCRSGRRLGQPSLRYQKPCRNCHQTNRCLHKLSR